MSKLTSASVPPFPTQMRNLRAGGEGALPAQEGKS